MSSFSSASALVATILAALTLMFVWGGTERVTIEWKMMEDDYTTGQLVTLRNPMPEAYSATDYGADGASMAAPTPVKTGDNYVFWLNISGMRSDYALDDDDNKAETPFLDELAQKGSYTENLHPAFPSLRYPTLISQATGVGVETHGVVSDTMRHPETKEISRYPTDLTLLKAEPIWTTAKRQGLRVLVHDWPFSQKQSPESGADVFLPEFDESLSDEDRLNRLFDAWAGDQGQTKLRLVMGSLFDLDKAIREYGCREPETFDAVEKLDSVLKAFFEKLESKWPELSNEGDQLYVFLTTDHGMADAKKLINFRELMGQLADQVDYTADEVVAHVWFKDPPQGKTMDQFTKEFDDELKARIYWRTFKPEEFPADWKFGTGGPHMGDRVLVLKPGYALTAKKGTEPVFDPGETAGPFSCSGFLVADSSRMVGQASIFKMGGGSGYGSDLGTVEPTQLYSTVCSVLKIQPAEGADSRVLRVD